MTFEEKKETYIEYIKLKLKDEDWHGVADAAMDLRELEAKHNSIKLFSKKPEVESEATDNLFDD